MKFLLAGLLLPLSLLSSEWNFTLEGEALYWTAKQKDMEFLRSGKTDSAGALIFFTDDSPHQGTYNWDWGYRLTLAWAPNAFCERFSLTYTHFDTQGRKKVVAEVDSITGDPQATPTLAPYSPILETLLFPMGQSALASEAESKQFLDVNLLELGFRRTNSQWGWCLGARGAFFCSDWHTEYLITNFDALEGEEARLFVDISWEYQSGGPFVGLFATREFGCGFFLYGEGRGSLLYGSFKRQNESRLETLGPEIEESGNLANMRSRCEKLVPAIAAEIGVGWKIECQGVTISALLTGEMESWINLGENIHYAAPQGEAWKHSTVNVDLYGACARFAVNF